MSETVIKEKISVPKKHHKKLKKFFLASVKFLICFLSARTSLFFEIAPFGPASMLATGGGAISYIGAMVGYFTTGSFEGLFFTTIIYILKIFIKSEKADSPLLLAGGSIVYASIILQGGFLPYNVILRFLSVLVTAFSYFPLKKAYKAQFKKSTALKFTKKEGYCSIFLLFVTVLGIRNDMIVYLVNLSDIIKIYIITAAAYLSGIGGGAAVGAIFGILSGTSSTNSAMIMSLYSLFGFFSGIFSKFTKLTSVLGLFCAYVFACIYIEAAADSIYYMDMIIAGALFLLTPARLLRKYFDRYSKKEHVRDMMATVNSITASRLEKLANSFTGLSNEIAVNKKDKSLIDVNYNSMFDFLSEKVCGKCTLKNICWQKEYDNTVTNLTTAVKNLEKTGNLEKKDFDGVFAGRCVKLDEMVINCRNFYDILKVNAVWKNKMCENTFAFKQQFIEMSNIICELKKNIETNKYYEAELSGELYSVLTTEGFMVKDVFIIRDVTETFYVKIIMFRCRGGENCIPKIKQCVEDVLGVTVSKEDGGCGEHQCTLYFKEGNFGAIEQRVYNIAKNKGEPAGDSYKISCLSPNKYLVAVCDGMGSGKEAREISESVISLTEEMLKAGFSEEATYKMINSFILANLSVSGFSTMDFIVIDTKNMTGKIVKNGACPTYIRHPNNEVTVIKNTSLPIGIREQKPYVKTVSLTLNDMIIMVTDGTLEANEDKEWINKILKKLPDSNLTEAVDLICSVAQKDFESRDDDVTVLGVKLKAA